ncbi:MAG: cupin domain-containing protein [Candidatus Binatia bacterium]
MAKLEKEFFDLNEIEWKPIEGGSGAKGSGILEKILSRDEKTGDYTRLLRFDPGVETDEVLEHDFWEEVIILEGSLVDKRLNHEFTKGMYACRPPGMKHGPYRAPNGCMTFEIRYYK